MFIKNNSCVNIVTIRWPVNSFFKCTLKGNMIEKHFHAYIVTTRQQENTLLEDTLM